jgi:hypothetical protein
MPVGAVRVLVWSVRLSVVALALYFLLITVAVCVILIVMARIQLASDRVGRIEEYEHRMGPEGFGLYDRAGIRIDPYDPDRAFDPDGGVI